MIIILLNVLIASDVVTINLLNNITYDLKENENNIQSFLSYNLFC